MEVVRFGVGHRRPEGPAGTTGLTGRVIHADGRGVVSELAFARNAHLEPHTSPSTTWLVVIEGGGWVAVGQERSRVNAGEAILWPADVPHAAWTEHSEMRAIVVEFAAADDRTAPGILEGHVRRELEGGGPVAGASPAGASPAGASPAGASPAGASPADGSLAAREGDREATTREGEPY